MIVCRDDRCRIEAAHPAHEDEDSRFIRVWQGASSLTDAARVLGITRTHAKAKAARMRSHGVPLKAFRHQSPTKDWERLIALAIELAPRR